jgi:RIO-like serine/threonine protein kinase
VICDRYLIHKQIGKGTHGRIFSCTDLETAKKLVIKTQKDHLMLAKEIQHTRKIMKASKSFKFNEISD